MNLMLVFVSLLTVCQADSLEGDWEFDGPVTMRGRALIYPKDDKMEPRIMSFAGDKWELKSKFITFSEGVFTVQKKGEFNEIDLVYEKIDDGKKL